MNNLAVSQTLVEGALQALGKVAPTPTNSPIATAVCNELGADTPTNNVIAPLVKRIGRPKGSKNKPKQRRGRVAKGAKAGLAKQANPPTPKQYNPTKAIKAWQRYVVKANDDIDENKPILTFGERLFASAGGIATISGKPKSCKTFLTTAVIGAFLNGEYLGINSHCTDSEARILLCDTEQGRARSQTVLRRIRSICSIGDDEFDERITAISVREVSAKVRTATLVSAIRDIKPKLVIIDGVRDLLNDFNNIQESIETVDMLMKCATEYDCAIVVVIHLNKGDDNIRGHLGSELCNKSETVIKLNPQSNGAVVVSPLHCRDIEFEEFAFRISDEALPVLCNLPPKSEKDKEETKREELRLLIEPILGNTLSLGRKEFVETIATTIDKSPKTAERRIDDAISCGLIEHNLDNSYSLINQL